MTISEGKLVNIALEMLPTHKMVDTHITALEGAPEAVNRVCVGFAVDMLALAMIDPVSGLRDAVIGREAIRVDRKGLEGIFGYHGGKFGIVYVIDYLCDNLAIALNDANNRGLRLGRSALRPLDLVSAMLVYLASAEVGLIHFDLAGEWVLALGVDFADTMIEEPSRLLRNAYHFGKLYARNTLLARREKIDSEKPFIERELRLTEDRSSAKRKLFAASGALVGLAVAKGIDVLMAAMRAVNAIAEAGLKKVVIASVFVREPRIELFYRLHAYNIA